MSRFSELFIVKRRKLHWRIDAKHSAPTGEWCNVDGFIYHRDTILAELAPANIRVRNGRYQLRRVVYGERASQTFATLAEALAA